LKIGGMGEVVEATNQNGEEVVVKFPASVDENGVVVSDRRYRDFAFKLKIEADILKNFVHSKPHSIVNYLDESNDPNNYFLVMEKVDGETVGQKLAGSNPLSENEIIRLSVDVLRGLEFLHKHNTIYRDMKPPNIMIRKNGSAVLIDFGTAKQGVTQISPQQNTSHTRLGSEGWTCPEQDIGRASTECDLYALGRVIFYMASGIQPFTISSVTGKMKKKLHQINSSINRQFSELVNDMIDPQHNKIHTASEIISELRPFLTSKPVYSKHQRLQAQVYPQTTPAYALPEPKIILEGKDHKISNLADGTLIGKLHDECEHCNKLNYGTNIPVGWKCSSGCRCDLNPAHMIGAHHMRIYRDKGQIYVVNNDPERNSAINTAGRWRRMEAHRPEVLRDHDQVALLYNERKGPYMSFQFHTQ
jgi:serine/threonine protein kinase